MQCIAAEIDEHVQQILKGQAAVQKGLEGVQGVLMKAAVMHKMHVEQTRVLQGGVGAFQGIVGAVQGNVGDLIKNLTSLVNSQVTLMMCKA